MYPSFSFYNFFKYILTLCQNRAAYYLFILLINNRPIVYR